MKILQSVRNCYSEILPGCTKLKDLVDGKLLGCKSRKWHYESRIKELESFALKLETGREPHPHRPEDLFACTLVVENHSKIPEAAKLVTEQFKEEYRRPDKPKITSQFSHSFGFEDLRIYVAWVDDPTTPPTIANGLLFEVQIKTFLQHAWGIATHDLIYKTDEANWGSCRVAYQVKAMLENAEVSISEAKRLTTCSILDRTDARTAAVAETIARLKDRWTEPGTLPANIQGLANNILDLARNLRLDVADVWAALDKASDNGRGAKLLDLCPYAAVLESLITEHGERLFRPLAHDRNERFVFVPNEVELPHLPRGAEKWIVQPSAA